MQVNLEGISFITPFSDSEDQTQPKLSFECVNFPAQFSINFRVGMVGLKPNTRYQLGLFVIPAHLFIKEGQGFQLPDGTQESVSVNIDTKDSNMATGASGQVVITLNEMRLPGKGLYSVTGVLHANDSIKTVLHKNESFFTVDKL